MATKAKNTKPTIEEEATQQTGEYGETTVGSEPIETKDAPPIPAGDSKINLVEREIWDNKLANSGTVDISFSELTWGDNVRSAKTLQIDKMIHSMKTHGYMRKYPIIVSRKSAKKYLVLCGNRRTEALQAIKDAEPDTFKEILPSGKIVAYVFDDLTEAEEALIRQDHSEDQDRVPLDDEGIFLSVKQLVKVGLDTQADIAAKLNLMKDDPQTGKPVPNRSFIQQRVNLAKLPSYIQDEFLKFMREGKKTDGSGASGSHVRWAMVAKLFKLFNKGRADGDVSGGTEFAEYWATCINPAAAQPTAGGESATGPKMMSKKDATDTAYQLGSRVLQQALLMVTGVVVKDAETEEPLGWSDIDGEAVQCEQAMADLAGIATEMGETKFKALLKKVRKS